MLVDRRGPAAAFAAALSTVGGGGDPVGTGYGWVDVTALRRQSGPLRSQMTWAASALGPDAAYVVVHRQQTLNAGIDADVADALVAISASFTFGLRLDGLDPRRFSAALRRAHAKATSNDPPWRSYDLGEERTTALGTNLEPLGPLAPRTAVSDQGVILARINSARNWLMGAGEPATTAASIKAATNCLGDVVAARIVPNNFTHATGVGAELLAFGVQLPPTGPAHEVLCAIDPSAEKISAAARALRTTFSAGSRDELSGKPFDATFSSAAITTGGDSGQNVARADLTEQPDARPGFLFTAFVTGSMLTYEGLQPPIPSS